MFSARDSELKLLLPTKQKKGFCPGCGQELVAKMGEIKIHHWAHVAKDCDPWREPESAWHYDWKIRFGLENTEKPMGDHRADVFIKGMVVEIQHSQISDKEIIARSEHYKKYSDKLVWILDFTEKVKEKFPKFKLTHPPKNICRYENEVHFYWQNPKEKFFNDNVIIDIGGNGAFVVKEWHSKEEFSDYKNDFGRVFESVKRFVVGDGLVLKHSDLVEKIKTNTVW